VKRASYGPPKNRVFTSEARWLQSNAYSPRAVEFIHCSAFHAYFLRLMVFENEGTVADTFNYLGFQDRVASVA
jgi:hypothetical protein